MPEVDMWEIIGASAKGFVRSLIAKFVPGGNVAGVPLADLATIALAYYLSKKLSGNWRKFARGLLIKSAGDVIESYLRGAIVTTGGGLPGLGGGRPQELPAYRVIPPYEVV